MTAFQRRLQCKPKVPPEPLLSNHVSPNGMLSHQQPPLVVPQPFVDPPGIVGTNDTLSRNDWWSDLIDSRGRITCSMDTKSLMRSSRISSMRPRIPARKKILVCPYWKTTDMNYFRFDLDKMSKKKGENHTWNLSPIRLTLSITACVAAMFFFSSVTGLFTFFIAATASLGPRMT